MSDQPLAGTSPFHKPTLEEPSIVDTILDLDAFLSGDVRRAERSHRFASRPDLEARIDDLEAELDSLTDDRGRPLESEQALGRAPGARTAVAVAQEIEAVRAEIARSFLTIKLRQMADADYRAWREKWHDEFDKPLDEQSAQMWNELVAGSASAPTMTVDQAAQLRERLGTSPFEALATTALQVNRTQGVSVPKSPLSSVVLSTLRREQS